EPLKEFGSLRRLGQDPARAPQTHGAHTLQLPPHADAMPRRLRGQARQERQPAHECTVTFDTNRVKRYAPRQVRHDIVAARKGRTSSWASSGTPRHRVPPRSTTFAADSRAQVPPGDCWVSGKPTDAPAGASRLVSVSAKP